MKKSLLLNALKIAFLAIFLPISKLQAQQHIQVTETRPDSMTVCMGNYTFSLKIKNITASPVTAVNIMLDLPDYISYTGNLTNAIELSNDPETPAFEVPLISANDSVIVTYSAAASCGIVETIVNNQTIANNYGFTYIWGGTGYTLPGANFQSYNLLYANLSINTGLTNPFPNYQIGDQLDYFGGISYRSIMVSNGGNGAIDTIVIRIIPEPEITYLGFFSAGALLPLSFTDNGTEIIIKIAGNNLANCGAPGGDPNLFEGGESLTIHENFIVDSCATGNTNYRVAWGCDGEACNDVIGIGNATTSANINVQPGNPQFTMTSGSPLAFVNYCGKDGEMVFYFKNTGASANDFATDLKVDIFSYEDIGGAYVLPFSFELFDYTVNSAVINAGLITADGSIPWHTPGSGSTPGYSIDFSNNTDPAILDDLDGDGFYDDLPAGDTLVLKIKVRYLSTPEFDSECPVEFLHRYGSPQIAWETVCGDSRSTSAGTETYRYINYSYYFEQAVDKIHEPADFVEGIPEYFTFCTGNWHFNQNAFDCPVNEYQAVINLPVGYHLSNLDDSATWHSFYGDSISLLAVESGNQITVSGGGTTTNTSNPTAWTGCYTVQLDLICPETEIVTSPSTISWEMRYKCDTCDVFQRKACASEEVYNHVISCPDTNGCQGIVSRDFDVQRTTFGWTDETQTTLVTADSTVINLDAAYPFDEVQSTTSGEVIETGFDNVFVEVVYDSNDTLFSFLDGQFKIYDGAGNQTFSCPATPPVLTIGGGEYTNTFQMPCFGVLQEGDSVVLVANWLVLNSTPISPAGVDVLPVPGFRSKYLVDFNDTLGFCDSWGENFFLYSVETFPVPAVLSAITTCDDIEIGIYWSNLGGTLYNDFPNEFRNTGILDNIVKFVIPPGYEYVEDSSQTFGYTTEEFDFADNYNQNFQAQITPTFSTNGDTIIFDYDWKLLDKYGKNDFDYTDSPIFTFHLRPTCEHEDTIHTLMDFNYTKYAYADPQYHELVNWREENSPSANDTSNVSWFHYLPNLQVSTGLGIVDGYENTVQWDVTICNPQGSTPVGAADGVWLDIDNVIGNEGNIEITSVQQIGSGVFDTTLYNNDESAFVEVNSVGVNACRTFRIKASYTECQEDAIDSLRLLTGWNCGGFPEPQQAETASCLVDTSYLMIRYKSANLQMAIIEPSGTFEVCDTLNYEVVLTSSEPANMYDLDLFTSLPTGAQIIEAEYRYPETSASWLPLVPGNTAYDVTNPFGWDLSTIIPQFEDGFVGSRFPNENEIRIRFGVVMDCDFNPAQDFVIYSDGITNCNDTVELNAHYFLPIAGFEDLVNYELTHTIGDTLDCMESNLISYTITNQDNVPNVTGDSLRIELPAGFTFVAGSGTPTQPSISGNELLWPVETIPANGTKTFTFQIESATVFDCTPISLPGEIFHTVESNCSEDCFPTASWQDTANTIYCCDPCMVNADFSADTVCVGDPTCFDVTDSTMIGVGYTHQWDFGDDSLSNENEPCHTYAIAGIYNVTHIVVDSTGCTDTLTISVVVSPEPSGSIELLGCNPFCVGDSVYLTVNGTYESIEWVYMNDGTVIGTQDTIAVTQGGVYTAVLTNGVCVDSCLAITLSPQPLPVIDIADTVVCSLSDSVTLDAGAGYTIYNWSTGDTTQTITVGAGTYWVEVGEKLPFGCCTCTAVDTVVVNLNDINVVLNDTTICSGDSILLNPIVSGGLPDYSYLWNTGDTTNTIYATSSGTYSVLVIDAAGCQDSASMELQLSTAASAEFSYADTVCLNDTTCFVALNPGIDSWSISDGMGEIDAFGDTSMVCYVFTQGGTFTVEHILISECGRDTVTHTVYVRDVGLDLSDTMVCTSSDSVTLDAGSGFDTYLWNTGQTSQTITAGNGTYWVEVGQLVGGNLCTAVDTVNVTLSDLAVNLNDTTACAGGVIIIQSYATGGVPPYERLWNTGQTNYQIGVVFPGTYWVTVTDAAGCQASDTMELTLLYPGPSDFTFDDTICVLDTACFVGAPAVGDDVWNIYNSDGEIISTYLDSSDFCFQFASTGTYTVEHVVTNDCFSDTIRNIITVIPPIEACIVMIGTNPFCEGDTVLLTINDPFNQVEVIDWYKDSILVASTDTLIVTEPGTYTAMVEDENGCTSACMCIVLTQIPNLQVNLPDTLYVCGNGDTVTIIPEGSFESYLWYLNGNVVGNDPTLTVSTPGTYYVEATSENGCTSTDSTVVLDGTLNITLTRSIDAGCIGQNVTLTATFGAQYTYQWQRLIFGSWQTLPGSGNQITTPIYRLGNNLFRVIVTDQVSGCKDTAAIVVQGIVGPCTSLIIAPNPTINERSTIYYSLHGRGIQKATVEILNMRGQQMKSYILDIEQTSLDVQFNGYAEGVYMVRLICDGEVTYTDRLVVLR